MRAPSPADLQRLALLIEAEAIQLREFVALLEREEALLVAGDTDGLLTLTQDKTDRYRQLQRLHDDKALLLGRLGRNNADAAIRELCAGLPRVLARWDEVLELARNAKERNALNGKLITERMQHNQAALSILLSAANHPQLYDAAGQTRPTGGGRILGSA
ncbi:flagellar protein FlgN [Azoarcus sp. DD4]|uniref:flagella synthesis protein FlgN n=1 Tax=Azoarcus sp. DD4 TaxID=2027405 RepID=UPI00112B2632|nr:flagellar protein FlgN [Azoarcus sp. DD4]QDF98167.1 flagellar protein FlgN [Azoarcus sp. DD4]